jgi:murein DD-endopeptidase MepM/ murein hydrolase activator NlpD
MYHDVFLGNTGHRSASRTDSSRGEPVIRGSLPRTAIAGSTHDEFTCDPAWCRNAFGGVAERNNLAAYGPQKQGQRPRRSSVVFALLLWLRVPALAQNQVVDLVLPTNNDALFHGGGPAFYQYIERDYKGQKSTPWEGGQYGFVRDPVDTAAGIVYTRFHEGIDIRCLRRDANGEPLDEVRAIGAGKVVYTNFVPAYSNYGKYIVIEHRWDGSPYYSLYGHLSKIDVHVGQAVQRGEHVAVMGYTGAGLNQARAHLHLELNLMLSHHFEAWYDQLYKKDPNRHGVYNGINLNGIDIARLFLELRNDPALTIPQFFEAEETFYKVRVSRSGYFELPKNYPWMVYGDGNKKHVSWDVSFARSGVPLKIEPSDEKVSQPELTYVKPSPVDYSFLTRGEIAGRGKRAHLTEYGQQLMRLLIYPK